MMLSAASFLVRFAMKTRRGAAVGAGSCAALRWARRGAVLGAARTS
jgi:hypothetical protein